MPAMVMTHAVEPRDAKLQELGDLHDVEIFNNQVLCAVYLRPERTASGLFLPDATRDEDKFQSKVGLVIKLGAEAFIDPTGKWSFADIALNDWIVFRPSDGWSITVNGVLCRILDDTNVRGRIQQPDQVW